MVTSYSKYIKSIKYNKIYNTYNDIKHWLDKMKIKNYTINPDLTVDVDNVVSVIGNRDFGIIPIQFGIVKGLFHFADLTSLVGSPKEATVGFDCKYHKLTSLDGYSIYNLKNNINRNWYKDLSSKIKEEYFDKNLNENPDLINYINFETSKEFKTKWEHFFNANKFDLI